MNKKDIKVNAYDGCIEVYADNIQERKYRHIIDIPSDIDIASAKSTYRNGILYYDGVCIAITWRVPFDINIGT